MSESDYPGAPNESPKARAFTLIILLDEGQSGKTIPRLNGLTRVGRSVFRYEFEYSKLLSEIELPKHLAFRKGRAIPKVRELRSSASDEKTYSIVSYRFRNPSAQQKKKVQRLRLRSPSAKLRPGLLLFPHFRTGDGKKIFEISSKRPPLSSKDFAAQLTSMGAEVNRWTRMRPINSEATDSIQESITVTVQKDLASLEKRVLALRDAVKTESIPVAKMKERYSETRRLFEDIRTASLIVKQAWSVNYDSQLQRIYNLLLGIRRRIRALAEGT